MKKHLSLIVMALFASAMLFTSCGKEQYTITVNANDAAMGTVTGGGTYDVNSVVTLTATPNEGYEFVAWNDGNTDNPREITVTADAQYTATFQASAGKTTISFRGNSWDAANLLGVDYSDDNYLAYYIFKTANDQEDVYLLGWLQSNTGSYDYNSSEGDYFKYYDPTDLWTDEDNVLGQGVGDYYRWTPISETFVENITAIDLNELTISATWSEDCFDVEQYVAANLEDYGTTYTLNGNMNRTSWEWASKKAGAAKVKNQPRVNKVK